MPTAAGLADALPTQPPQAAIVITGKALPQAKAERVYGVVTIDARRIEQSGVGQAVYRLSMDGMLALWQPAASN